MRDYYLQLSIALAKAEFKLRNEGSYLGIFWYLLNPLLTFAVLFILFSARAEQGIAYYSLYLLLGIIMFNFFQQATFDATKVIQGNRSVIKSIKFPIWILISSAVLKLVFSHVFEIIVFFLFMFFLGVPGAGILLYPVILIFFSLFVFGVSLALSAVSIYFADLENIWIFASRLLWFATPIFYTLKGQSPLLYVFNFFNPLYYFISAARDVLIYAKMPEGWILAGIVGWPILALAMGFAVFFRLKGKIAQMI